MTKGQVLLERSIELTKIMDSSRALWDEGKGKDYGTATSYMSARGKRSGVIAQLRSQFRLVVDNGPLTLADVGMSQRDFL